MSSDEPGLEVDDETLELLGVLADNQEALTALFEAIDTLDQSGLLDLLTVVGTRDSNEREQFFEAFAEHPPSLRLVQNLSLLGRALGRIDPERLATSVDTIQEGDAVGEAELANPPRLGPVGIVRKVRDPSVQRGLGVLFLLIETLGNQFDRGSSEGD